MSNDQSNNVKKKDGKKKDLKKIGLAYLLISLAFIMIGWMLYIQQESDQQLNDLIKSTINNPATKNQTGNITAVYDSVTKANQALFNILLPVFSAWVVAVVSYYFHSEAQKDSTTALNNANQTIASLTSGNKEQTIGDILDNSPSSYKPIMNEMSDSISKIKANMSYGNVVIVKDMQNYQPLGVLYDEDIDNLDENSTLSDMIKSPGVKDHITGKPWSENGISNYATMTRADSISSALQKMSGISSNEADKTDVRALVLNNGQLIAILDYQTISSGNA